MASILKSYEYDVFISYRQNDNRSGWVTEFVTALQEELAATIKEPLSVYFDSNPTDGLLEIHHVDKSLEGKLKCLVFIPIVSQTYCDTKSFAWQHEFCAFNKISSEDEFGRDIRLNSGNVSSRILPVKIHDLDAQDSALFGNELGGALRSIEFIFRSPGVNRPLRSDDRRDESLNRLSYRDQINKVANAIKDITNGMRFPDRKGSSDTFQSLNELATETVSEPKQDNQDKSIGVLPFVSLSQDASQEYFADGITENIIIQLAGLPQLRVISRTSVMRYKNTTRTAPEIANELGVKYILEGSAQTHNNKVRITVQLIDALLDKHVWSKVFVESMDDIFTIQSSVSEIVAGELQSSLNPNQNKKIKEVPTKNLEAYDLFLKGRHAFNQWSVDGYRTASEYFLKAVSKDPEFREAYSYLASSYSARMSWNGDLSPNEAKKYIEQYLAEAWKRGPSENDYLTKAFFEFFINKDFSATKNFLDQGLEIGPNNSNILYTYSYVLNMMGKFNEALAFVEKAKALDPLTVAYYNYKAISLYFLNQFEEAVNTLQEGLRLYPGVVRLYDYLGRIYLTQGNTIDAIESLKTGLQNSNIRPPSMVAYLAAAYANSKTESKAKELLTELINRSEANEKGVNIYLALVYSQIGDLSNAKIWLQKAQATNDVDLIWWQVDPLLKPLRELSLNAEPDYSGAETHILSKIKTELPHYEYHNLDHINDVLQSVIEIAKAENLSEDEIKLLRVAALFHDSGFIYSPKNHEEKGAELAQEILPAFGFGEKEIASIGNMIKSTRIPQTPVTKLDKVLCDADLDYLGRDDFYTIGSRLYEEFKKQGIVETEREWNLVQKTFLESHRYHTDYSLEKRDHQKKERLQEIVERLKKRS